MYFTCAPAVIAKQCETLVFTFICFGFLYPSPTLVSAELVALAPSLDWEFQQRQQLKTDQESSVECDALICLPSGQSALISCGIVRGVSRRSSAVATASSLLLLLLLQLLCCSYAVVQCMQSEIPWHTLR